MALTVGVLALQGGFHEHLALLRRAAVQLKEQDFEFTEVRNKEQLSRCQAVIIPGGESTTMALVASQTGLLEPLREFVKIERRPTWGTCAGLIMLAEEADATKKGGQELIGGLDIKVHRNHFGRQIESFVADLNLPFLAEHDSGGSTPQTSFPGVFIRAPIVDKVLSLDSSERANGVSARDDDVTSNGRRGQVEILGVLPGRAKASKLTGNGDGDGRISTGEAGDIIAVRQGNVFGVSFHPELTDDVRIHAWWLKQVSRELGRRKT